jgi:hypothetical protein
VHAVFTALIGIAVPFFGGLLGFFGGFAFAPTTYYVSFFSPFVLLTRHGKRACFHLVTLQHFIRSLTIYL